MTLLLNRTVLTAAATVLVAAAAWGQWSFQLDTTFRTQIVQQNVNSLLVLPNGQLIASGIMRFPGEMTDKRLVRMNTDGVRDESFNNSGLGGSELKPWQGDTFYVRPGNTVRRILPNGILDPSFIGMNSGPYFLSIQGGDYHVFPDGRVLLSGWHTLSDSIRGFVGQYNLVWFSNTGYLDTTRVHRQANGVMRAFTELPDGKFLCSCTCTQYEGQPVSRLFRIHADGSLDTTFNAGVNWGNILAYHPLPDGRVYVGGRYKRAVAPNDTLYLARFMPDGSLDGTFLPTALSPGTLPNPSLGAAVVAITPWHNGTVLVGGRFRHVNGDDRNSICLLEEDGMLNNAFDGQGIGVFTFASTAYTTIAQILTDSSGQWIYICGAYAGYDDGTTNDPQQRFVSRLLVSELTVGVEEQAAKQGPGLRVYPNPAGPSATVYLEHLPPNAHLLLRDALGRVLHQQHIRDHTTTMDLRPLADGLYTVELLSDGRRAAVQRLVVGGQ